jgi:hypothetical protein
MKTTLMLIGVCALVGVWCTGAQAALTAVGRKCTYETDSTGTLVIVCPKGGAL